MAKRNVHKSWSGLTFLLSVLLCLPLSFSCVKDKCYPVPTMPEEIGNVLLIYAAGKNNLATDIRRNIQDFCNGYTPQGNDPNILLVYENLSTSRIPTPSYLVRIYGHCKRMVRDTLAVFPATERAASAVTLNKVLNEVRDRFPAKGYGLLFTSHATGWLPKGYYNNSEDYDNSVSSQRARRSDSDSRQPREWVPFVEPVQDPSRPAVKSIGADWVYGNGVSAPTVSPEIDLPEFADAIPMYLDYIFFDCCLMGCVEAAWELKDKCGMIISSPTEVLSTGFDYTTMSQLLIGGSTPDLVSVCSKYYDRYNAMTGAYRSATVNLIDCNRLKPLASACRTIFSNHREMLDTLSGEGIQQYFQDDYHWFYDLRDIAVAAGATEDELADLDSALEGCIIYKAATDRFISFAIDSFSGFSMYLPGNGSQYLNNFYRELAWNGATGLVAG